MSPKNTTTKNAPIKKLPDAEFDIMKVVWANEPPITTNMIMEQLGNFRKPQDNFDHVLNLRFICADNTSNTLLDSIGSKLENRQPPFRQDSRNNPPRLRDRNRAGNIPAKIKRFNGGSGRLVLIQQLTQSFQDKKKAFSPWERRLRFDTAVIDIADFSARIIDNSPAG